MLYIFNTKYIYYNLYYLILKMTETHAFEKHIDSLINQYKKRTK